MPIPYKDGMVGRIYHLSEPWPPKVWDLLSNPKIAACVMTDSSLYPFVSLCYPAICMGGVV
jgi:hypothetical protein